MPIIRMTTDISDAAPYIAAINRMKRARGVHFMATQVHVNGDVAARARLAVERMMRVGRGVRR